MLWIKVKEPIYEIILYAIKTGEISIDQRRGVVTCIFKKGKVITSLKKRRPLSVLNSDCNILAKTLAVRLQSIISRVILMDQSE
jgi:hypothetical protein